MFVVVIYIFLYILYFNLLVCLPSHMRILYFIIFYNILIIFAYTFLYSIAVKYIYRTNRLLDSKML